MFDTVFKNTKQDEFKYRIQRLTANTVEDIVTLYPAFEQVYDKWWKLVFERFETHSNKFWNIMTDENYTYDEVRYVWENIVNSHYWSSLLDSFYSKLRPDHISLVNLIGRLKAQGVIHGLSLGFAPIDLDTVMGEISLEDVKAMLNRRYDYYLNSKNQYESLYNEIKNDIR